jgi:nucleoside-diphosphate-sugar epimerase
VWADDAPPALVVGSTTEGLPGTNYFVDDEPLTRAQLAEILADLVGRPVRCPPTWLVRLALGRRMAFLLRSHRVSNRRFTAATGWTPQVRSAADGLPRLACQFRPLAQRFIGAQVRRVLDVTDGRGRLVPELKVNPGTGR